MSKTKRRLLHVTISLGLIVLGIVVMGKLSASKPKIKKAKAVSLAPLVRVLRVHTGPQRVVIRGEGTVHPLREIRLVPQVAGKVVYVSPALVNGGHFSKGDTLLRIDPVDYELAVTLARARVKDAETRLQLSGEESAAAREEWRSNHPEGVNPRDDLPPLVAKEPQLAAARAGLEAAQADLKRALLNLERTTLQAPFDGRVSQESVGPGQYVSLGQSLATLYSTEKAEIVIPLEHKDLLWLQVPGFTPTDSPGSDATVLATVAGRQCTWEGKVVRTEGKLDEKTRMIRLVVLVKDPYASKPPLAVGLFVQVRIKGHLLQNATLIPRSALHEDNVAWVVDQEKRLRFRKVEVARSEGGQVLVRTGLNEGDEVVVSPLEVVTDGMAVRILQAKENRS